MTDLERALGELAVAWPETPDLVAAVDARIGTPRRSRRRWRRVAVVAVATLVAALAVTAVAFPDARDDVLEWLGLRSVEVEHVDELPPDAARAPLSDLGPAVTREKAAEEAGFTPLVPEALGDPQAIRVQDGVVSLVYDDGRLLVAELKGAFDEQLLRKIVAPGSDVRRVPGGIFFSGRAHAYLYLRPGGEVAEGRPRLAGDTLVTQRGDLLIRVEGRRLTLTRAQAIASSLREG